MKQIALTQGQYAIVDDADYEELSKYKWYAQKRNSGNFYAARTFFGENNKRYEVYMSRQILGLEKGDLRQADHQNHNTLDNSRINLRVCTQQENLMNQESALNTTSRFKGVHWYKRSKKWRAQIVINKKVKHLGYFIYEKLAALAYNEAAKKYFGEFANLNLI